MSVAGVAPVGVAAAVDTTEVIAVAGTRRTLPPAAGRAVFTELLNVSSGVLVILKLVSCVCDREIFRECLVKSLVFSFVRFCFELEKILERFYLYVKKIGVRHRIFYRSKTDPLRINSLSQWNLFLIKSKMKKRTKGLRPRQVRKPPGLSLF